VDAVSRNTTFDVSFSSSRMTVSTEKLKVSTPGNCQQVFHVSMTTNTGFSPSRTANLSKVRFHLVGLGTPGVEKQLGFSKVLNEGHHAFDLRVSGVDGHVKGYLAHGESSKHLLEQTQQQRKRLFSLPFVAFLGL
jgi:hypothetical protein